MVASLDAESSEAIGYHAEPVERLQASVSGAIATDLHGCSHRFRSSSIVTLAADLSSRVR